LDVVALADLLLVGLGGSLSVGVGVGVSEVVVVVELEPESEDEQTSTGGDDGSPDDESGEVVDHEGVQDGDNDAGDEGVDIESLGVIDVLNVLLNIIETEVSNDVVEGWEVLWQLVHVWDTESLEDGVGSISIMANSVGRLLLQALVLAGDSGGQLAVNWVGDLFWALLDANSSWVGLGLWQNDVVQVWESVVFSLSAELSVTIDWSEKLVGLSILVAVVESVAVTSDGDDEQQPEQHVGALSVDHWTVSEFRVRGEVLTIVVWVLHRFAGVFISHDIFYN